MDNWKSAYSPMPAAPFQRASAVFPLAVFPADNPLSHRRAGLISPASAARAAFRPARNTHRWNGQYAGQQPPLFALPHCIPAESGAVPAEQYPVGAGLRIT